MTRNRDGKCQLFASNTTVREVELPILPVYLHEYIIMDRRMFSVGKNAESQDDAERRVELLSELTNKDNLNDEERKSITQILYEFPYQFHLHEDTLGYKENIEHKIKLTSDKPINVKQYRYPFALKEEVRKRIDKMI